MTITWVTINVSDFEASKAFYMNYIGLRLVREFSPSPAMSIAFFADDKGTEVELIHEKGVSPAAKANAGVSIGIRVQSYDTMLIQARSEGILLGEPAKLGPDVECFFVKDPNGVGVQIIKEI